MIPGSSDANLTGEKNRKNMQNPKNYQKYIWFDLLKLFHISC